MERRDKPFIDWVYFLSRCSPVEISVIVNEECQKINSMSRNELFNHLDHLSEDKTITIWSIGFNFYESVVAVGFEPELFVNAVRSILVCIRSRLELEWDSMEGTTSKAVMDTMEEIMSENITTSQHTVFYVVHQYMKTMDRIDKPITFERPVTKFQNTLLQIQEYHQQIVGYINDFDIHMERRRRQYYHSLSPRPSPCSIIIPPSKQREYFD